MTDRFFPIGEVSASLHPDAAYEGDAGYDLFAQEAVIIYPSQITVVKTGWGVTLEQGEVGLVCPRSGLATLGLTVVNAPGIIDSGYSGEIAVILTSLAGPVEITKGQAIAQLVITRHLDIQSGNNRFARGFGSSDN